MKLIRHLLDGKVERIDAIAQRLLGSERTVFRDLQLLREAGMAIMTENNGYSLKAENTNGLDVQELLALIFACRQAEEYLSDPCARIVKQSLDKVLAASMPERREKALRIFETSPCVWIEDSIENGLRYALNQAHSLDRRRAGEADIERSGSRDLNS